MDAVRRRTFGDLLRALRRAAGLTQEELAERAEISARGLGYLERGDRLPHRDTAHRLAEALALAPEQRSTFAAAARAGMVSTAATSLRKEPWHNLPVPPTPLVGREGDEAAVVHLLQCSAVRLLTLTGPGGVGKTRLALQVATTLRDTGTDGVWLVELAPVTDAGMVPVAIAQTLGLRDTGARPLWDRLIAHLRDRQLLLVLDNLEHLPDAAPVVADLLAGCPALQVLVTSRAPLHVRGEHEYAVPLLALPPARGEAGVEELPRYAAVALFLQRAQAVQAAFQQSATTAPAVVALCRRLDGLPLALELAAAWLKVLTPQALLSNLVGSWGPTPALTALTEGSRDLPARLRTLRSAIAWRYDPALPSLRSSPKL